MAKKGIKIAAFISIILIFITVSIILLKAENAEINLISITNEINPTTNFFGQKENQETVDEVLDSAFLLEKGYKQVATNSHLTLYLDEDNMGISVYDKDAKYIWYSSYPNMEDYDYLDAVKQIISSGIHIECFDSTSLNETTKYSKKQSSDCSITYDYLNNGFIAHLNFITVGVSFDVKVTIDGSDLLVELLLETLQEIPYKTKAMKAAKEYKLKAITVFPYFGSANYSINGYAFIPDASGALIRYSDVGYDTAFIKRVYGQDYGITPYTKNEYLKAPSIISLPIYGINHGYNQAAFLCQITEGAGAAELNSYPYMYSNINLNRTFFKFITRDKFNVNMASSASGAITLINTDVYHQHLSLKYHFLNGNDANYSGMARSYQKEFNFKDNDSSSTLKLDVVAQDYKLGLFGKNYITMTSYTDLLDILKELNSLGINNIEINYIGFNNNGYYDNNQAKFKLDSSLGSKKEYNQLIDYMSEHHIKLSYYTNPLLANSSSLSYQTIKMQNLESFIYTYKSSLELTAKYINPTMLSTYLLKNAERFTKFSVDSLTLVDVGETSFSYRYKGLNVAREEMINQMVEEMNNLKDYHLAMYNPNDYLYNYLDSYYDADYESSKYAFITDSIPFVSLVLSGKVNMYSTNTNYVSDYNLFKLRLVEYNIRPSFMITNEATNKLRYANFEYLYTTEYQLWKGQINQVQSFIDGALKHVTNVEMIDHHYLADGIAKISYQNGVVIYINYTNDDYLVDTYTITPMNYLVVGGDVS